MHRAGLLRFPESRAFKVVQLGKPFERVKNLEKYKASGVFFLKHSNRCAAVNYHFP